MCLQGHRSIRTNANHNGREKLVNVAFLICLIQGTESSDFSLISDFFPTPWTILETSVNLKRIFLQGGGMGIGVK